MGVVGTVVHIVFARILPVVVLLVAIFIGWLFQHPLPDGRLYATLIPLFKGYAPPQIVGHGKMVGTPPVPDDMVPGPRPENEKFITLAGSGDQMPQNGLGMCCRQTAYDDVLVERTILWYLLLGGRLIDGAHLYLNHAAIGRGIKEAIRRGVPRSEIFVTTKIAPSHFGYNTTKELVPTFLDELGLEYIDLLLMHAPSSIIPFLGSKECKGLSNKQCRQDTWKALSELREEGIIRNAGVSNFESIHLQDLLEIVNDNDSDDESDDADDAKTKQKIAPVAVNQIQWNPWVIEEWVKAAEVCHENNIGITGWNTLGGSLSQHDQLYTVKKLTEIADKYNRTVSQVMLKWAIQTNAVVIPGTGNPKYMKENLSVYGFDLTEEEMTAIKSLREDEPGKITSVKLTE